MKYGKVDFQFVPDVSDEQIKKEKARARELRRSRWWKQKCSKGRCYYCGRCVPPGELTMDHIVPLIRGGRSTRNNIVPACRECNSRKKYMLPFEWEQRKEGNSCAE